MVTLNLIQILKTGIPANFSICHWNLNSITANNFAKVNLLQAYNVIHDFDMICSSESYLVSPVSSDNDNLYIRDYKLVRTDQPGNIKRGDMCVYFKESLPVNCLPNPYLKECLIFKVSINKRGYGVSMYDPPSQTADDFISFTTYLEKLVMNISSTNPHFILMIGILMPSRVIGHLMTQPLLKVST